MAAVKQMGDLQQCRYCRTVIRLIPYYSHPSKPLQWGSFIDAPPVQLADPLFTYESGAAFISVNGVSRSIAGPFRDGITELPLLIPHNCQNIAKARAKREAGS